ncbi:hypothetical protein [Streptomyces sp. NPDC003667]
MDPRWGPRRRPGIGEGQHLAHHPQLDRHIKGPGGRFTGDVRIAAVAAAPATG